MSDINLDFTVSNNSIVITPVVNDITITPTSVDLNLITNGGLGTPNSLAANISNVIIYGGTNGQYIKTDGTVNLKWSAGGGYGKGFVGGVNTQVQFNNNGNFGGNVGFTFDKVTGNLSIPNAMLSNTANISNVIITGNGINTPGFYGDITGGNLFSAFTMNASVSMTAPNISANIVTANYIQGSPNVAFYSNITSTYNITGANVIGTTSVTSTGNITSNVGVGYSAGGSLSQPGSRSSPILINAPTGLMTLAPAVLNANGGTATFTLTNSFIVDTDLVIVEHVSGGTLGKYNITATPANGSAVITMRNNSTTASANEQPVLKFMIFRAVN
jgi:hypothetical protein